MENAPDKVLFRSIDVFHGHLGVPAAPLPAILTLGAAYYLVGFVLFGYWRFAGAERIRHAVRIEGTLVQV